MNWAYQFLFLFCQGKLEPIDRTRYRFKAHLVLSWELHRCCCRHCRWGNFQLREQQHQQCSFEHHIQLFFNRTNICIFFAQFGVSSASFKIDRKYTKTVRIKASTQFMRYLWPNWMCVLNAILLFFYTWVIRANICFS